MVPRALLAVPLVTVPESPTVHGVAGVLEQVTVTGRVTEAPDVVAVLDVRLTVVLTALHRVSRVPWPVALHHRPVGLGGGGRLRARLGRGADRRGGAGVVACPARASGAVR